MSSAVGLTCWIRCVAEAGLLLHPPTPSLRPIAAQRHGCARSALATCDRRASLATGSRTRRTSGSCQPHVAATAPAAAGSWKQQLARGGGADCDVGHPGRRGGQAAALPSDHHVCEATKDGRCRCSRRSGGGSGPLAAAAATVAAAVAAAASAAASQRICYPAAAPTAAAAAAACPCVQNVSCMHRRVEGQEDGPAVATAVAAAAAVAGMP
mmetsp:Transcript_37804/g.111895  ORF Transcript_37804/g.111895 Transcript_37804/m.111895 type:complete len:211 (+) Transcript_37804:1255-1887(+)